MIYCIDAKCEFDIFKYLLESKCDVNILNYRKQSPLYCVATYQKNSFEIAKYLVDTGSDINLVEEEGNNLLHAAALNPYSDPSTLNYILKKISYDINAKNKKGLIALHNACSSFNKSDQVEENETVEQKMEKIKILVENKSDVNSRAYIYENTPIFNAALNPNINTEVLDYLIEKKSDIHIDNNLKGNILHTLCSNNPKVEVIQYFIDKKLDINNPDKNKNFPLFHLLFNTKDPQLVKFLIDNKADLNAKNIYNDHALSFFFSSRKAYPNYVMDLKYERQVVKLLIEGKSNLNSKDYNSNTPLHNVIEWLDDQFISIVSLLIESKSDLSAKNENRQTPLHIAIKNDKNLQIINLLSKNTGKNEKKIKKLKK